VADLPITRSLKELVPEQDFLGSVIQLSYEDALIATTDFRQEVTGGIPKNAFLTAAALDADGEISEVILFTVVGPEPMNTARELVSVREELANAQAISGILQEIDPQTESRLASIAFRCKVLGTFYKNEAGKLRFGADMARIRGNSLLKVYRPRGRALSLIGSFSGSADLDSAGFLEIGKVRYSDTQQAVDQEAGAFINIRDFIGKKTALFGQTRSGKSNSTKTILQKVHFYSRNSGDPVAQLVFDPQGEYAQANSQDGSAIADIGDETEISIYKIMEKSASPKEKYLQFDLFKNENLALTWQLILGELTAGISKDANYIAPLFNIELEPLGEGATIQERYHFERKKLGLFALMYEGIRKHPVPPFTVSVGAELAAEIALSGDGVSVSSADPSKLVITNTLGASKTVLKILKEYEVSGDDRQISDSWVREIEDGDAGKFFEQIVNIREKGRNGVKASISRIEDLHSPHAEGDVRENVWQDIRQGKLIVVDLSRGSSKTSQVLSELIVNYLLDRASERFIGGLQPVPFQIVVEEAHNLFERDSRRDERDPWVRISKEASKYRIGLLYATQEVTSVDRRILSNTSNWIIAHLSSVSETNELAKYYQFADWGEQIRRIETKGFARVKTESSAYIIPVQIELFQAQVSSSVKKLTSVTAPTPSAPDDDAPFQF
jgi:DNA helicase HerA-like ATPase